jgi:hypothetical protein
MDRLLWLRRLRRAHRYIALLTSVQLLLWTVGGIYFAFFDISAVRGEHLRQPAVSITADFAMLDWAAESDRPIQLRERMPGELIVGVAQSGRFSWRDVNGDEVVALTQVQAIALANSVSHLVADTADWIDEPVSASEYRGRALPMWRVYSSQDPKTVAYLDVYSGELVAIRGDAWRVWDFLWSLHIMDYDTRDHIGTPLLKVFSVMALLSALLGLFLFVSLPKKWT